MQFDGGINFYLYAMANPLISFDSLGLVCYTHRYPIGIETIREVARIGEWGRWKYENIEAQGGEGPAFWIFYHCACSRERPVMINSKMVIKFFVEEICVGSCWTSRTTRNEYKTIWRYPPQDKEKDIKWVGGGLGMNEFSAILDCERKCDNLNR